MPLQAHVKVLEDKHHKLETTIAQESHRPSPDFAFLQTLKKQKLILKEELMRIRAAQERLDAA